MTGVVCLATHHFELHPCRTLDGTNKNDAFWAMARRKRRVFMFQIECNTTLSCLLLGRAVLYVQDHRLDEHGTHFVAHFELVDVDAGRHANSHDSFRAA